MSAAVLIFDRVLCDECLCLIGQLHNGSAEPNQHFTDNSTAPDYCVCPDCRESLNKAASPSEDADQ